MTPEQRATLVRQIFKTELDFYEKFKISAGHFQVAHDASIFLTWKALLVADGVDLSSAENLQVREDVLDEIRVIEVAKRDKYQTIIDDLEAMVNVIPDKVYNALEIQHDKKYLDFIRQSECDNRLSHAENQRDKHIAKINLVDELKAMGCRFNLI